ncbi:uncharacterized protein FMAN_13682 [Fusarium mangiferae]|uniref:Mid2 domain-containing protein n=1 Tax=Fusarium mangiferae TaxID=192010 RepID=A0A1L7TFY7_FUSMA|nr:uncharacterized protein FMAN_13682 [Fusarium mangiferae]CVK95732.1 uncharacterized protein FMAN_13682 [Fusarium mangiferae]
MTSQFLDLDRESWNAEWKSNNTYRFINVHNGTKFHLDCIPNGPVFMSPDVDDTPYQSRQQWLMTSAPSVNDKAFSTTALQVTSSTPSEENPTSTAGSESSSSGGNNFALGKVAGISIGVVLGVMALAISMAAFILWRATNRRNGKGSSPGNATQSDKGQGEDSSAIPPHQHFSPEDVGRVPKCAELDGDPLGAKLPSN